MKNRYVALLAALLTVTLAGCASLWDGSHTRTGVSSSLVDYLYPDGEVPPPSAAGVVQLKLPARVGLAFVPTYQEPRQTGLPEALKQEALERVRQTFRDLPYIQHLEVLPETYLRHGRGGFATLEQLGRLYGFDLIALVSYDQVSVQSDTRSSILYWTLAGAYVVKGDRLETSTFIDTAVIDIRSRRLLFRAAGTQSDARRATLVETDHDRLRAQQQGFTAAMQQMTLNLQQELDRFRERVREDASVKVSVGPGGAALAPGLGALLLLAVLRRRSGAIAAQGAHARFERLGRDLAGRQRRIRDQFDF